MNLTMLLNSLKNLFTKKLKNKQFTKYKIILIYYKMINQDRQKAGIIVILISLIMYGTGNYFMLILLSTIPYFMAHEKDLIIINTKIVPILAQIYDKLPDFIKKNIIS